MKRRMSSFGSRAADYAPLARLPKGLVLGFIDAGPFVLMETPHSVLAAPYHRNVKGNVAMLDLVLRAPDEAKARLAALGVDYVAFCPGAPERHNYAVAAADGLVSAPARGDVPDFLERIPLDGTSLGLPGAALNTGFDTGSARPNSVGGGGMGVPTA